MSSSQASVSTATMPTTNNATTTGNKNINKMKLEMPPRPAKMPAKVPPRGNNTTKGKAAAAGSGGSGSAAATEGSETEAVPHVVRVTFLGVAGLLAKPMIMPTTTTTHSDGNSSVASKPNDNETTASATTAAAPPTAVPNHPQLLFPLPPQLRVVACVSRSRTARGIPSGMSKSLSISNSSPPSSSSSTGRRRQQQRQRQQKERQIESSPVRGESIIVEKQSRQKRSSSSALSDDIIDEISITRDQSTGLEVFDHHNNNNNNNDPSTNQNTSRNKKLSSNPAPPSQLLHSRTTSSSTRSGSGIIGGSSSRRSKASIVAGRSSSSSSIRSTAAAAAQDSIEGIEVIRPYSPTTTMEGGLLNKDDANSFAASNDTNGGGDDDEEEEEQQPSERLVAVWDEVGSGGSVRAPPPPKSTTTAGQHQQQQQQQKFVNMTNSLAFEAELRPFHKTPNNKEKEGGGSGRLLASSTSSSFAPKSFCVTVGLVPDGNFDYSTSEVPNNNNGNNEIGNSTSTDGKSSNDGGGGGSGSTLVPPIPITPAFAIPVGFADLVINGDETLDGKRKQIDLPLSSLGNFLDMFGAASGGGGGGSGKTPPRGNGANPFPLIELTAAGFAASGNNGNKANNIDAAAAKIAASSATGKMKKKSIVKRMFSRKHNSSSAAVGEGSASGSDAAAGDAVYSGPTPRSIFQLGRPPNASERSLFLHRYGVDPTGDAVVRIGLEIFPRGSELEKIFRQKNKMRKKAAAAAAAMSNASRGSGSGGRSGGGRGGAMNSNRRYSPNLSVHTRDRSNGGGGRFSPACSVEGSRTFDTNDSRSLMDDEYDGTVYSDCDDDDSIFSQSFFTLDSGASQTTWDESTMYTDALSTFNTFGDDDDTTMSYNTGFTGYTEYEKSKDVKNAKNRGSGSGGSASKSSGNFLVNFLNCSGPTSMTCGLEDEEDVRSSRSKTPTNMMTPQSPYANIDTVASAVASMSMVGSMVEEGEGPPTPRAMGRTPRGAAPKDSTIIQSVASMDTATQSNHPRRRQGGGANSPTESSIKESGEELTLDNIHRSGTSSSAKNNSGGNAGHPRPTSLDTNDRAVTMEETSPLATIKQRFTAAGSQDFDELDDDRRQEVEEELGTEFTLEEHQSSM